MSPIETQLFAKIQSGELRFTQSSELEVWDRGKWRIKIPNQSINGRWRYVFGKNRTRVYRNRLVWMVENKRGIPDDCFVDHVDVDRLNDAPANLRLMPIVESHKQGFQCQQDRLFQKLCRWWDFIIEHRRVPSLASELTWVELGF